MRRLCYHVAASLDGYIAGPHGEYDWIVQDPDIDFAAIFAKFGTAVMGRKTFEVALQQGESGAMPGLDVFVYSRTLKPADYPAVSIIQTDPIEHARALKEQPGKDIWLFGGGELFRTLLNAGLIDIVELAIIPVIVGEGIRMLPPPATQTSLSLAKHRLYPKSGIMLLEYEVKGQKRQKPQKAQRKV